MTKVRTLVESLKGGHEKAFENLDEKVEALGDIELIDIKDNIYPMGYRLDQEGVSHVERIVIYKEKKKIAGEPWRPTLDTDLMEFLAASQPPRNVRIDIDEIYGQGKTNIRELIAMPYGWFKELGIGGKKWEALRKLLRRYGFNLYKKGRVIED